MNYSEENTSYLVETYKANPEYRTVEYLAETMGKSTKSIIGKLSREGVYQRAVYTSKTGETPVTKIELVTNIAENLGIEVEDLVGLDKSPKAALKALEVATGTPITMSGVYADEEDIQNSMKTRKDFTEPVLEYLKDR